jgi:type VI secretion system secreted protein Hcp
MNGRTRGGALLLACALLLTLPTAASAKLFLELPGIPGESQVKGFENQIELDSYQWGVSNAIQVGTSGAKAGKPAFSEIVVSKQTDKASPQLMLRTANGVVIASARLRVTKSTDTGQTTYLRYCFTGVQVTSFTQSSGGDLPTESVGLSYASIVQSYTQQDATGGVGNVFSAGWDLVGNMQFGGACDN